MKGQFAKCVKCPASFLLDDPRKDLIDRWERKRESFLARTKQVKLILLGESMPAGRYFYDIEADYEKGGLRYTLKQELSNPEIDDGMFLMSLARKGVVLFDCALCPLHKINHKTMPNINHNAVRREAATYCFLTINKALVEIYPNVPIVTIFPKNLGFLKTKIPNQITQRLVGHFSFSDQTGLASLFEKIMKQ